MKDKKIVFMGTPSFAALVLENLIKNCTVIGVVCQPDKEVGRKHILTSCPVKEVALKNNIKVLQPVKLKEEINDIIKLNPDMIVTCAYGQILPLELLEYPKYKTINVHGSLLPKLRGGAPIQRAIINGEIKTGITIMRTDKGMDSGDIITSKEIEIEDNDNYYTLANKLSILGSELLIETLPSIFNGTCLYKKQDLNKVTYAPLIKKEDEHLSFNDTSRNIYNKIRGLNPDPCCYIMLDDVRIKILEAKIGTKKSKDVSKIINVYEDGIGFSTKDGEIIVTKLQVAGKKITLVKDYLNGINKDSLLGKMAS